MPAGQVWRVDDSGPTFVDETADFNSLTGGDLQLFPEVGTQAIGDYVAFGFPNKFSILTFGNSNGTPGVGGVVAWDYWKGDTAEWTPLVVFPDSTENFTASGDRQHVAFTPPGNWAARALNGSASLFYVRARITTIYSTNPIYDWGLAGSHGFVWWDRGFIETSQYDDIEQAVRVNIGCLLHASGLYFENSLLGGDHCPFIDATEGGGVFLNHGM
jgi:hypothetical protein